MVFSSGSFLSHLSHNTVGPAFTQLNSHHLHFSRIDSVVEICARCILRKGKRRDTIGWTVTSDSETLSDWSCKPVLIPSLQAAQNKLSF